MANPNTDDNFGSMMSMDSILSNHFWDSVLVPGVFGKFLRLSHLRTNVISGYSNTTEGLSGGFVFGAGGSGRITPHWGQSPSISGANSPLHGGPVSTEFTQQNINAAFNDQNAPLISSS
jgi:hypothetical protein